MEPPGRIPDKSKPIVRGLRPNFQQELSFAEIFFFDYFRTFGLIVSSHGVIWRHFCASKFTSPKSILGIFNLIATFATCSRGHWPFSLTNFFRHSRVPLGYFLKRPLKKLVPL